MTPLADETEARAWLRETLGCDEQAMARLERLVDLLREENAAQNLVSTRSLEEVWVRHIADSAQLLPVPRGTSMPWLDLGTGAGFPGLVIAALDRSREIILVESRTKRVDWLLRAASALSLDNVRVEGRRLEVVPTVAAGVISARAFAPLARLVALSARFSTSDTIWLLPKGRNGAIELAQMPKPIREMFHVEPSLTGRDSVVLVGRGRAR